MEQRVIIPIELPQDSFRQYLLGDRRNRISLCITAAAIVIQFAVFKYFYPFASYIYGDSFVYLETAYKNLDINTYLVGYSRFLRLFSVFSSSDTALVAFQYLFIQSSALFFLFTLFYFYQPGKLMQMILLAFIVLNPLFLHLANLVSSDGFFMALSLIWITLLLWIIHRPNICVLLWHALVLFAAFTVRYNALIYPAIATVVVFLSKLSVSRKIVGAGLGLILCGLFILYTGSRYKLLTGKWQYSPFSGWQMANNAMYAYRYVNSADRKSVPTRFKMLDNMIRTYFDSTRDVKKYPVEGIMASTVYMWTSGLPLSKYRDLQFKNDDSASALKKWATVAPLYADYGAYIIRKYPWQYARYFLWPNAKKYYAPPIEFLKVYNSGYDHVTQDAQKWFGYSSTKITARTKDVVVNTLDFYPIFSGVINVVMLCSVLCFGILNGFQMKILFRNGILIGGSIWLSNAGFTIFASSAALRFQSFPIIITAVFTFLLVECLWKMGRNETIKGRSELRGSKSDFSAGILEEDLPIRVS